jgi:hypothetical protein
MTVCIEKHILNEYKIFKDKINILKYGYGNSRFSRLSLKAHLAQSRD